MNSWAIWVICDGTCDVQVIYNKIHNVTFNCDQSPDINVIGDEACNIKIFVIWGREVWKAPGEVLFFFLSLSFTLYIFNYKYIFFILSMYLCFIF